MNISRYISRITDFRSAAFIVIAGLLGGTSQGIIFPKVILYSISILLLSWVIKEKGIEGIFKAAPSICMLTLVFVLYTVFQLIPLPPEIWTKLPGRTNLVEAYNLMGIELPSIPAAMNPSAVFPSLLSILPPFAIFSIIICVANKAEQKNAFWAVPLTGFLSLAIGILQVLSKNEMFVFYAIRNEDSAIGVFSNINHHATLQAVSLCFVLMFAVKALSRLKTSDFKSNVFRSSLLFLVIYFSLGLFLNGSVAGYLLIPLVFSGVMFTYYWNKKAHYLKISAIIIFFIGLFFIDFWFFGNTKNSLIASTEISATSRRMMYSNGFEMAKDFFPFGSGLGSFPQLYPLYEDAASLKHLYAPHVHNDHLEFIIELGIVGILLIVFILFWLIRKLWQILRAPIRNKEYALAAVLGMICILVHSLVDYPARTLTISTIFALCLGIVQVASSHLNESV